MLIKYRLINACGLLVSCLPAIIATFQYYPAIVDATSSFADRIGVGLIIAAILVMAVVVRFVSVKFPSPTPDVLFGVAWVACELLQKVVVPMSDILFWAFLGAAVGRVVFAVSDFCEKREMRRLNITQGGN